MLSVDLNCDIGEGADNDSALMDHVSSVNIACGLHAGDRETMRRTVENARDKGVAIGAHPGYPDRENFGRLPMDLSYDQIYDLVTSQVNSLAEICAAVDAEMCHVKPHGALYNRSASDAELAHAVARAVFDVGGDRVLFGLSGSHSITEAKKLHIRTASEVFADRTYRADGSLTPRDNANALIEDSNVASLQVLQMVESGTVTSLDGQIVPIVAETVCIHGDGPYALAFAAAVRRALVGNGIDIKPI